MEFVRYILGNFWHFIGFTIILGTLIKGLVALVAVILGRRVDME